MKKRLLAVFVLCLSIIVLWGCNANNNTAPDDYFSNDARFVTYNGKIIYRRFGVDSLTPLATDAKYLESPNNYGESDIMSLDPKTMKSEVLFKDRGTGKLYIHDGYLYSYRYTEDWNGEVYRVRLDGTDEKVIADGYIYDVDEAGRLAIYRYIKSSLSKEICVYEEDKLIAIASLPERNELLGCKLIDGYLVYVVVDKEAEEMAKVEAYSLRLGGSETPICMGYAYVKDKEGATAVVSQIDAYGEDVYFSVSLYDGGSSVISSGCIISAKVDQPESLEVVREFYTGNKVPAFYLTKKNGLVCLKQFPNLLMWEKGYVYLTDEKGRYATLFAIDSLQRPSGYEDEIFDLSFEVAEQIGNMVYVMYNLSVSSDENEDGWWNNYQHFYTGYLLVDMDTSLNSKDRLREFDQVIFNDPSYAEYVISVDY